MPSARNAIQNILTRSVMDPHLWLNDPDGLLVRKDSNLSLAEVQSLTTAISLIGGAVLISDDMTQLSPERRKLAASLLPVLPSNPLVRDLFTNNMPAKLSQTLQNCAGEWKVIALFNWQDQPTDLTLNLSEWDLEKRSYLMREFWTGEIAIVDDQRTFMEVPPHGVRLIALREMANLVYLGSDLHFAQGAELIEWNTQDSMLSFRLNLGRNVKGNVYLWTQSTPTQVRQNGKPIAWHALDTQISFRSLSFLSPIIKFESISDLSSFPYVILSEAKDLAIEFKKAGFNCRIRLTTIFDYYFVSVSSIVSTTVLSVLFTLRLAADLRIARTMK